MDAAALSHASGRDHSVDVLWEDAEHVSCRVLQNDAEGHRHAFAPSSPAPSIRRSRP
jgi:hypothetical protein